VTLFEVYMRERGVIIRAGVVWGGSSECEQTASVLLSRLMKASGSKSKVLRVFSLGVFMLIQRRGICR